MPGRNLHPADSAVLCSTPIDHETGVAEQRILGVRIDIFGDVREAVLLSRDTSRKTEFSRELMGLRIRRDHLLAVFFSGSRKLVVPGHWPGGIQCRVLLEQQRSAYIEEIQRLIDIGHARLRLRPIGGNVASRIPERIEPRGIDELQEHLLVCVRGIRCHRCRSLLDWRRLPLLAAAACIPEWYQHPRRGIVRCITEAIWPGSR